MKALSISNQNISSLTFKWKFYQQHTQNQNQKEKEERERNGQDIVKYVKRDSKGNIKRKRYGSCGKNKIFQFLRDVIYLS